MKIISPITAVRRFFYLVHPRETIAENVDDVPQFVEEAVPYFALFIVMEYIIKVVWNMRNVPSLYDGIASISAGIISQLPSIFAREFELAAYIWCYYKLNMVELPWDSVWTWVLGFIGVDFCYYWLHRAGHVVNIVWANHQVHHSSEYYNFTTALRQALCLRYIGWFFYLPLTLFLPPPVFLIHQQFSLLYQFWIHTELVGNLGPLELILNTPSHHRVHHGRNVYCVDKNYGGTLIVFDRIFGTFQEEKSEEPPVYGLVSPLESYSPFTIQFHSMVNIVRRIVSEPKSSLKILFYSPAWTSKGNLGIPAVESDKIVYQPQHSPFVTRYAFIHFIILAIVHINTMSGIAHHSFYFNCGSTFFILLSLSSLANLTDKGINSIWIFQEVIRTLMIVTFFATLIYNSYFAIV